MDTESVLQFIEAIVALIGAVSWPLLVLFLVLYLGAPLKKFIGDVGEFTFKAGTSGLEASAKRKELQELPHVNPAVMTAPASTNQSLPKTVEDRINHREGIYEKNRGVFLAHVLEPSKIPGQKFDIFIFLIKHEANDMSDVEQAEFFLGKYWGNKIVTVINQGSLIGMSTSAYGPFLCTCKVVFKDGYEVLLDRYIDFEMGKGLKP